MSLPLYKIQFFLLFICLFVSCFSDDASIDCDALLDDPSYIDGSKKKKNGDCQGAITDFERYEQNDFPSNKNCPSISERKNSLAFNMAVCYREIGEYEDARIKFREATHENLDSIPAKYILESFSLWMEMENNLGAYFNSLDLINEVEAWIKENNYNPDILSIKEWDKYHRQAANTYRNLNEFDKAEKHVNVLQDSSEERNKVLNGLYYHEIGNYKKSIEIFNGLINEYEAVNQFRAKSFLNICLPYLKLGKYRKAADSARKSHDDYKVLDDEEGMADAYNNLSDAFRGMGQLDSALYYAHHSLELYIEDYKEINQGKNPSEKQLSKLRNLEPVLEYMKSKTLAQFEIYEKDSTKFNELISTIDAWDKTRELFLTREDQLNLNKVFWNAGFRKMYEDIIEVTFELNDVGRAFSFFEKSKSVILRDRIGYFSKNDSKQVNTENISSVEEVKKELEDNQVLVEYFVGLERIYALAISKGNEKMYSFDVRYLDDVKRIKKEFREQKENAKSLGLKIYEGIFKSIHEDFSGADRFVIVGDGELEDLSFDILMKNDEEYLLNEIAFSYNYSAAMLFKEQKSNKNKITYFAPIEFSNLKNGLDDLLESGKEVARLNERRDGDVYELKKADKNTFLDKIDEVSNLHLATHALGGNNPRIYFYDDSLMIGEIYKIELEQLDEVVLSACETSAGQQQEGEGVNSLARAFVYAGARKVIAASNPVYDKSTRKLFVTYYELNNENPSDIALQQTKIKLLENKTINDNLFLSFMVFGAVD